MTREELERQLRKLITGCLCGDGEDACPFCHCGCNDQTAAAMQLIDAHVETRLNESQTHGKLWDADQVAAFLGLKNAAAARSTMSRWGIASVAGGKHPESKRNISYFPADKVRTERASRKATR